MPVVGRYYMALPGVLTRYPLFAYRGEAVLDGALI